MSAGLEAPFSSEASVCPGWIPASDEESEQQLHLLKLVLKHERLFSRKRKEREKILLNILLECPRASCSAPPLPPIVH